MNLPEPHRILNWKPLPYLVALLFTLFILTLHMLPNMDSMLNENNTRISHGFLKSQIDYHQEIAPFARRPMTSFLIERTTELFRFRPGHGFILVNFTLLCLSGCLLFRLSKILKATTRQALVNLSVYFLSFSVLFAFFPPVFSYDEPLQYCFLLLAFTAFVQRKWLWYVPTFTLALISRETSMLLLPALLLFSPGLQWDSHKKPFSRGNLNIWIPTVLPLILYGIYLILFIYTFDQLEATRVEMGSRYTCFLENFESLTNTVESLTSLYLAIAPFVYLAILFKVSGNFSIGTQKPTMDGKIRRKNDWINAFLLSALINSPIVILTAFARETRLFALPLFFIWPVFAQIFAREIKLLFSIGLYRKLVNTWMLWASFFAVNLINFWFCFQFYRELGLGQNTYYSEYLFIMNLTMTLHFLLFRLSINRNRDHNID